MRLMLLMGLLGVLVTSRLAHAETQQAVLSRILTDYNINEHPQLSEHHATEVTMNVYISSLTLDVLNMVSSLRGKRKI